MGIVVLNRRRFLQGSVVLVGIVALISLGVLLASGVVSLPGQQPPKMHGIGFLVVETPENARTAFLTPILGSLAELGYVEGQNLAMETRFANGQEERLPSLAAELVQANVD